MRYKLEELTSVEFEVLATNYVKTVAPKYNWELTKETVDFNRDFEATYDCFNKWGEAKHTCNYKHAISKSQWDPTLVSAVLKNNVNEIYLVTCGWTPLEYVDRAEHFRKNRQKTIANIYYINRSILDEWLEGVNIQELQNFNKSHIDIVKSMQRIKCDNEPALCNKNGINISVYNISGDLLEATVDIYSEILYEVNITAFTQAKIDLSVCVPNAFKIIECQPKFLSYNGIECTSVVSQNEPNGNTLIVFSMKPGYNRLCLTGTFDCTNSDDSKKKYTLHTYFADKKCKAKKVFIVKMQQDYTNKKIENIGKIENAYMECCQSGDNHVIRTEQVDSFSLGNKSMLNGGNYTVFYFGNSVSHNSVELCRLIMLIVLGIDYVMDCAIDFNNILNAERPFFPAWLNKILIGTTDSIFAVDAIENANSKIKQVQINDVTFKVQNKSLLFLHGYNFLSLHAKNVLNYFINCFKAKQDASLMVLNMLESSPKSMHKVEKNEISLIDMLFSDQTFQLNDIENTISVADKYYQKTEFPQALFYYKALYKRNVSLAILNDSVLLFKYADCLNHCGSLRDAQNKFEEVVNLCSKENISTFLEAKTEIFNIRFWRLDVDGLVSEIDALLNEYGEYLNSAQSRDKYALYNCYNRKMVTQYLVGDYVGAEETFQKYISQINDNYTNYLAFAYMDSARGLYSKDISLAQRRLLKAMDILKALNAEGQEHRRYLDCVMEEEYVKFIIDYESGLKPTVKNLTTSVIVVRNEGYTNMAIKGYLKLAACCLAISDLDSAKKYLNYVQIHSNFDDAPRVDMLYNMICSAMYNIRKSEKINSKIGLDYNIYSKITFNPNCQHKLLLDARIW